MKVVPTAGKSFEADMAERDKTADTFREIAAMGGDITVGLHADLDDEEIRRVIRRYAGVAVKFELVEHDSTVEDRNSFRHRWEAAGAQDQFREEAPARQLIKIRKIKTAGGHSGGNPVTPGGRYSKFDMARAIES